MVHLARQLPPRHLPWFWDTVAHRLISWDPKAAGRAYTQARTAEREHALPVDPAWRRENVLLLARAGALPAKELSGHQAWLAAQLDPADAHAQYVRVLTAWAASPGGLPADLARRVRASVRAAGLDAAEEARVLAPLIGAAHGKAVPDTLLDAVAALLADHPQDDGVNARLLEVFPESRNDAAAWLRLLLRSGAAGAVAAGRITPEGGLAAWLGRYTRAYSHRKQPYGGVSRQPMPPELLDLVARFAPRLRAAGQPVRLHEDRYRWPGLDADLLDLCLAERLAVEDPGERIRIHFWGERSRRDLKALAGDPVFGPRLEGTEPEPEPAPETEAQAQAPAPATAGAGHGTGAGDRDAAAYACVTIGRDDAARLPLLLHLVAERGPLAPPPEALELFSRRTGVRRAIAALVLGGLPGRAHHDEHLKLLRAAPYRADKAMAREYDDLCHRLGDAGRRAVLAAGVPEDPAELWERGAMTAAAERMAAVWAELLGTTPSVDEELAAALEADLGLGDGWARALTAGPAAARALVPGGAGYVLVANRSGGLTLHHAEADGSAGRPAGLGRPFPAEPASVVAWALAERPAGDPAARGAVALYGALRARLEDPATLIPLCWNGALGRAAAEDPAFVPYAGTVLPCPEPPYREDTEPSAAYDDGLFVVAVPGRNVFLRPAALADPQRVDRAVRLCGELGLPEVLEAVRRIQAVCGGGLARMVARATATPVPPGGYELNPALSAPELVAEAARALGVGEDAAALHLQLLSLARPTDRNVRRWNGWTPGRHKAARAELEAAGVIDTGKRARAGRTAFAPGGWTEFKAPHLPLETAKLSAHGVCGDASELRGPFIRLLPPVPPHELFALAWAEAAARADAG
ncbi:hypothetical protein ACIPUC_08555 [Streptomyces sp. LARHCF249]